MRRFDEFLTDQILDKNHSFEAAKRMILDFLRDGRIPGKVSDTADELKRCWSIRDADKVLGYSGQELWATLRPGVFGVSVEISGVVPARLKRELGEGSIGTPRETLTDLRGKERYG